MSITVCRWNDPVAWDRFIASTANVHYNQSWEWGDLAPDLGGEAVRLAAIEDERIVGAMQVFINPVSLSGGRTTLYVPRGPAVTRGSIAVLGPLVDAARRLGEERRSIGIRLEPNVGKDAGEWKDVLSALGFFEMFPPTQPRSSWLLDISLDEDALLAGMKQKTRYNIRLASRKGVEIFEGTQADMDAFYSMYKETAKRDGFFIHDQSLYERMYDRFRGEGMFCMLLARYEGEMIAAATLLRFGGTCWYLHGASTSEHRNLMAPHLLQWAGIQQARRWGCGLYDFRGVPDLLREDQDMYGVYRFKEGFGGYQWTTLPTYAAPYKPLLFGGAMVSFRGRFALDAWRRRRGGLPVRQFA